MTKRINMLPGAAVNGGIGVGVMRASGNPWTVPDALAYEAVNRGLAVLVDAEPQSQQVSMSGNWRMGYRRKGGIAARVAAGLQVIVALTGDSNIAGAGTGTSGAYNYNDAALFNVAAMTAKQLNAMGINAVDGAYCGAQKVNAQNSFLGYDPRWKFTGGFYIWNSGGLGGDGITTDAPGTATFVPGFPFDSFEAVIIRNGGNQTGTYTCDGQPTVYATLVGEGALGHATTGEVNTGGLRSSITINCAANGGYPLVKLRCWNSKVGSVQLIKCGWAGGVLSNFTNTTNPFSCGSEIRDGYLGGDLVIANGLITNDAIGGTNIDTWETGAGLFTDYVRGSGADLAWATSINLDGAADPAPVNSRALNERLRQFAARRGISLIEMELARRPIGNFGAGLYYDTIHNNPAGAIADASTIASFIAAY